MGIEEEGQAGFVPQEVVGNSEDLELDFKKYFEGHFLLLLRRSLELGTKYLAGPQYTVIQPERHQTIKIDSFFSARTDGPHSYFLLAEDEKGRIVGLRSATTSNRSGRGR